MKTFFTLAVVLLTSLGLQAQVNGYAKVTSFIGPVLTVTNINETYDQFDIGDQVIVMQMQDNVIGSNTANNSTFGNIASIANAGRFEVATVLLTARVSGILNVITLSGPLTTSFNTGSNSSVQIITFPTLGSPNYSTTSNINALPWDGNIGGIVAFNVNGILTMNHNISADNAGFRGGATDSNNGTDAGCNNTTFFSAVSPYHGNKGEGIYKATDANYTSAIGRIASGGGGGNGHNSGGGGGANYTSGGDGGNGYNCSIVTGGFGGATLGTYVNGIRYFLGGGGGSGEANNASNTKGGNGGGIVLIKANELRTAGSAARRISADGQGGNSSGNDGAGGGGAGGTLFIEVNSWNVIAAAPLTMSANGANGGNVTDPNRHGGGAGGGQGAVLFSSIQPTTNTTTSTANGTGGLNSTSGTRAANGAGVANSGVVTTTFIVLPVKLISFTGTINHTASLQWITENEKSFNHFEIQFSEDGNRFYGVGKISANGGNGRQTYDFNSNVTHAGIHYYRLKMVDNDFKIAYSKIITLRRSENANAGVSIFPNPATKNPVLSVKSTENVQASIAVLNMQGALLSVENKNIKTGDNAILLQSANKLSAGIYNVRVMMNGKAYFTRMILQ